MDSKYGDGPSRRRSSSESQQRPFDLARQSADAIRSGEKARSEISKIPTNMDNNPDSRLLPYEIKDPLRNEDGTQLSDNDLITIGKQYKRKELREDLRTVSCSINKNIPLMQESLTGAKCNELMGCYSEFQNNAYSRVNNRWYLSLGRHLMTEDNYSKAKGEAQRFIGALQELSDYLSELSTHVPRLEGSGDGPSRKDKGKGKEKAADRDTLKSDSMVESSSGEQRLYKELKKLMEGSNENERLGKTLKWAIDHLIDKVCIPFLKEYDEETKRILGELTNIEQTIDGGSTKDILQEQHKELEKYESKRIKLINLKSEIEGRYKDYLTFYNQLPVSNDATRRFLLDQAAAKYYKTEPDSNVVSPSILSRSEKLVEQVKRLETVIDEKIAEMQKQQKSAMESLSLGPKEPESALQSHVAKLPEELEGELKSDTAKQIEEREGELQPHVAIPPERPLATLDPAVQDSGQEEKNEPKQKEGKREGELKSDVAEQIKELEKPLKSDVAEQIEELEKPLEKMFADKLKSMIPDGYEVKNLWRLCTDKKYQNEGPTSSKYGNLPSEPHFVVGVMKGFHLMLQELENKLTPESYKQLHDTCIEDSAKAAKRLEISTGSSFQEGRFGKFMQDNAFSHLKLGYRFQDQVQTEHGLASRVSGYSIPPRGWYSNAGIWELRDNYKHKESEDPRYGANGHPVGKALMGDPFEMIRDQFIAVKPLTSEECEAHAKSILDKYHEEINQIRNMILSKHDMESWTHDFVSTLSEEEIQQVLTPIVHCCRDLSLSHLFWDGNKRFNSFILPAKLMMENDLLPPIMEDPSILKRNGIEEIVTALRKGQDLFKEHCLIPVKPHVAKLPEKSENILQPHGAEPSERPFAEVDPTVRDSDPKPKAAKGKQVEVVGLEASTSQTTSEKPKRRLESDVVEQIAEQIKKQKTQLERMFARDKKLKKMIPNCKVEDLWRLCIDEKFQREDPISSLHAMEDASGANFEPYFLPGMMRGLAFMLQGLGSKLTPEYYEQLHDTCIKGDSAKAADRPDTSTDSSIQEGEFGKFMQDNAFSHLKLGYRFQDQVQTEHGPAYRVSASRVPDNWYTDTDAGLAELLKNYEHRDEGDPRYPNGHPVGKALWQNPSDMIRDRSIQFTPWTLEECKTHAKLILDKYDEEISQIRAQIAFNHKASGWSRQLVSSLSEREIQQVLTPIAHCCRDLSLSHLFWDGNGRVSGFIVLPKLLIENGFLPPIMKSDPSTVDRCGIQEIITAIREGQELFKERCQNS